jgi:hypothetical protein
MLVYVGAGWCAPCQEFHRAATESKLDAAFPDLTLLEFDADRDGERLVMAGYIPDRLFPWRPRPDADERFRTARSPEETGVEPDPRGSPP